MYVCMYVCVFLFVFLGGRGFFWCVFVFCFVLRSFEAFDAFIKVCHGNSAQPVV